MGGTIRYLPYLRIIDLAYKLIACVHHQYNNTVRHMLEDSSDNIFLFFRWIVKTLEQRWLEVSLNLKVNNNNFPWDIVITPTPFRG